MLSLKMMGLKLPEAFVLVTFVTFLIVLRGLVLVRSLLSRLLFRLDFFYFAFHVLAQRLRILFLPLESILVFVREMLVPVLQIDVLLRDIPVSWSPFFLSVNIREHHSWSM